MSIRKHTVYNLFGTVVPITVSLVTIPLYIDIIGESRYGVLAIAWLLLGYFGLFDLGLGRATAQRIASLASENAKERSETFWTALLMNSALGLIGALIMWPVASYFFGNHFSVNAELKLEILGAVHWLSLALPVATMSGVLSGTLQGLSKFLELNLISVIGSALLQIVPLCVAVIYGPDLLWLIPATILTRLCIAAILFQRCYSSMLVGHPFKVSKGLSKTLLKFGGWFTISSVVSPMMVILDRFVIGVQMGARYVTFYTIPFQLAERTTFIPNALCSAMFPRLARAGLGTAGVELADKALRYIVSIITPLFLLGIFFIHWFLGFWINEDFASKASVVGQILLLGFWANAIARIPFALLQAVGRPDIVARCHLVEVIPYFLLLYFGLEYLGIIGAAIAFSLRTSADAIALLYWANMLRSSLRFLCVPVLLLISALIAAAPDRPFWISVGLCMVLLIICIYWGFMHMSLELTKLFRKYLLRKV
jgi:O-antigen/teichoic acid export membrane protein